jgi:hypothetical protein
MFIKRKPSKQIPLIGDLKPKKKKVKKPKPNLITNPVFDYSEYPIGRELTLQLDGYYLISSANTPEHFMVKAIRAKNQRQGIHKTLNICPVKFTPSLPAQITFCRISCRKLDKDDNLRHAFKNIKDGVSDWFGIRDDSDPRLMWKYEQEIGPRGFHAIRIHIKMMKDPTDILKDQADPSS